MDLTKVSKYTKLFSKIHGKCQTEPMVVSDGSFIYWYAKDEEIIIKSDHVYEFAKNTLAEEDQVSTLSCANGKIFSLCTDVLIEHSHYIRRLFKQKKKKDLNISLENFTSKTVDKLITYFRYGIICFRLDTVANLIKISKALELSHFIYLLEASLICNADNSLKTLVYCINLFATTDNLITVRSKNVLIALTNYKLVDLLATKKFIELSPASLVYLLANDDLQVADEVDVFRIAMYYIVHQKNYQYSDSILNVVRFNNTTKDELAEIKEIVKEYDDSFITSVMTQFYEDLESETPSLNDSVIVHRNSHNLSYRNSGDGTITAIIGQLQHNLLHYSETQTPLYK
uniref:BACK domain-containing protein n=1 Tax=Rhabditophanes sp. KR3021 TaxID=114890 RepID=A0AC35TNN4_9BILA